MREEQTNAIRWSWIWFIFIWARYILSKSNLINASILLGRQSKGRSLVHESVSRPEVIDFAPTCTRPRDSSTHQAEKLGNSLRMEEPLADGGILGAFVSLDGITRAACKDPHFRRYFSMKYCNNLFPKSALPSTPAWQVLHQSFRKQYQTVERKRKVSWPCLNQTLSGKQAPACSKVAAIWPLNEVSELPGGVYVTSVLWAFRILLHWTNSF